MEALLKEISNVIKNKNERIKFLEWQYDNLRKENEELKKENKVATHDERIKLYE